MKFKIVLFKTPENKKKKENHAFNAIIENGNLQLNTIIWENKSKSGNTYYSFDIDTESQYWNEKNQDYKNIQKNTESTDIIVETINDEIPF